MIHFEEINHFFNNRTIFNIFLNGRFPIFANGVAQVGRQEFEYIPIDRTADDAGFHKDMPRCHQVVEGGHVGIESDILEGTGNSQRGTFIGGQMGNILALKQNTTLLGMIKTADAVDGTGFACAVGPINRKNFAGVELKSTFWIALMPPKLSEIFSDMQDWATGSAIFRRGHIF